MTPIARTLLAGALALGASAPLAAQDAPVPHVAPQPAPVDPARIALAHQTVDYIWPLGTYERMMHGTLDEMMDAMMGSLFDMPLSALSPDGKGPQGSMRELAEIEDPYFKERLRLATHAIMDEIVPLMNEMEPDIREGLAKAYARKYDARQLGEMNAFFATPTGGAYARDAYLMFMDPEVMTKIQAFMPEMMERMPDLVAKMQEATAKLPPPRRFDELSPAQKARVATLKGKSVEQLEAEAKATASQGGETPTH